jgi:tetratricopeptide (TPR) repeat protein
VIRALALVLFLAACDGGRPPDPTDAKEATSAPQVPTTPKRLRRAPKTSAELPTTKAEIYLTNLDGQIAELTRLVSDKPDLIANVQKLSAAHQLRGQFRGDLDEMQMAIDGASTCIQREPLNASCWLMRAEQQQSLHRFKEARADLERAKQLGVDPARAAALEAELDWNDGLYDRAIAAIRKARRERPSTAAWLREAQLHHDLGAEDEADAAFEKAENLIKDVAPLPVAHLNVQRGIQKADRGLLEEALLFFREAVARMPTYVAANEHLAEALHALGQDEEAMAIYERVVALSDDPEFAHALGALYATHEKQERARELETKARARYEELLKKYPEAMYWHASEFFLSTDAPKRALDLLKRNVALRPNSASWVALARAELRNGKATEAKASIDRALSMPVRSASLFWIASIVYRRAGHLAEADAFRDRARRMNPRIEAVEGATQ